MSFSLRTKQFPLAALTLLFSVTSTPLFAFGDAPPGAYLQSTTRTQKPLAGSAQQNQSLAPQQNAAEVSSGTRYGQPLSDSMNNADSSSAPNSWNAAAPAQAPNQPYQPENQGQSTGQAQAWSGGQPDVGGQPSMGWQSMPSSPAGYPQNAPPPSPQYSGYAQQSTNMQQGYPQGQNYPQQPVNNGAGNWQADYPSPNDLNNARQPMAPAYNTNAQFNQPQYPVSQAVAPPPVPVTTKPAADPDDGTSKTISAIANTVLPIATSMVTNAIMNKMMYGTMMPGYGNSMYGNQMYGNPYGGMRNPMGGYGYNRPNLLNGVMGGGNGGLGGLLNTRY